MIPHRRLQRRFADGLIADEVQDLWEPWMRQADAVLDDEALLNLVQEELSKRIKKSKTRGRPGTTAEVVLRMLVLKHMRHWSFEELSREVRANLVYREFTRIGGGKVPDDKTMGRLARQLGPERIAEIHQRVVRIAQDKQVVTGCKMRIDTTVVETNIHYRLSSEGWRIQRESTPPGQESEPCSLDSQEEGNGVLKVYRQSHPWDGERVIGP
jgi:IS5 family transposase